MMSPIVVTLVASILITTLVTPLIAGLAFRRGLVDDSGGRHIHSAPVPRLGGPAVFAGMLAGLAALRALELATGGAAVVGGRGDFFLGLLAGSAILLVGGMIDDVRPLKPRWKLAWQVAAALTVYAFGFRIDILSLGAGSLSLGWLGLPVTLLWIVGVTNAYNLIDGLDGLATGIALVALAAVALSAGMLGHAHVVLVSCALIGALIGFIRYNVEPARIFLGDSGSLFIGFMLAVLSVAGSIKSSTAIVAVVPLFALALPLMDTSLAIGRRWLRGVSIAEADNGHIHHRLLLAGLTRRRAVQVLYLAATFLAAVGLFIAFAPPGRFGSIAMIAGGASAVLLLRGLRRLRYDEFAVAGNVLASGPMRARRVIRDRIYAQEVAEVLLAARSTEEVRAVLADNASTFDFAHIELCRESARTRGCWPGANGGMYWKLDFPIADAGDDPLVLRIWCDSTNGSRPYGAERVAHVLAPALERTMNKSVGNADGIELVARRGSAEPARVPPAPLAAAQRRMAP